MIGVGPPEPGACPLDGYSASSRGWVVPTVYETRTREPSGQGAVSVTSKQYYFWFLGNTIAGISPRIDLCPGVGVTFGEDASPKQVAQGSATATAPGGQKQEEANKASAAPAVATEVCEEARRPRVRAQGQSRAGEADPSTVARFERMPRPDRSDPASTSDRLRRGQPAQFPA